MKWLMGDQQPQQVPGTVSTGVQTQPIPAPPTPPNPVVFVEAKVPVVPPATLPVAQTIPTAAFIPPVVVPVIPTTPIEEVQPPTLPNLPDLEVEQSAAETPAAIISVDEKREIAGDLLSEAFNSSAEPVTQPTMPTFVPTPSSVTSFGAPNVVVPQASLDIPPKENSFVAPPVLPIIENPLEIVEITPITPETPEKIDPVSTAVDNGPDLPDVSGDIKRILQERWITLANTELAKHEKRHSDISLSLSELEKTQLELAAKKLKLEAELVEVEKSRNSWDKKKFEAQTTLDRVVKEVSAL